jgi:hypothetical protein
MADLFLASSSLLEAARRNAVDFLRIELRIANTMLDAAATATNPQIGARRHDAARAAYDEVARSLATGSRLAFSEPERAELGTGLAELARRFDASG